MKFTCPQCGSENLTTTKPDQQSSNENFTVMYACEDCKSEYKHFCGVPYFGGFYEEDLFSVMEVTSFLQSVHINENGMPTRKSGDGNQYKSFRKVRNLLDKVSEDGKDKVSYEDFGFNGPPKWLDARLNGHRQFEQTIRDLEFRNKTVLDIGAGTGFDACWFHDLGAELTCLEYNPLQVALANSDFPQFQWLGATVENMPFADETFDFVVANHALHHVVHLESSIEEMLRVLKVGGHMLTIADSYSPNNFTEIDEVNLFNNHPAVLRGVNEQTPQLYKFINALKKEKENLEVTILTPIVHGIHERQNEMKSWTLNEADEILSKHRGGICMRVKKISKTAKRKHSWRKTELVNFEEYLRNLTSRTNALTKLADAMPSWTLDLPITDNNHPKFRLLLGWQKQKKKDYFRTAIKEAHLFLSKKHLINTLNNLVIKSKECSKKSNMEVIVMVNAVEVYRKKQAANKLLKLKIDENTLKEYLDNKNLLTLKFSQNHENFESNAFMVYENTLSTKVKKAYYKIRY